MYIYKNPEKTKKITHDNVADISKVFGIWRALDDDGYPISGIDVEVSRAPGIYRLTSLAGVSYWQQHTEDAAYHSDSLTDMSDAAQDALRVAATAISKGAKVRMADGSLKSIENIKIGDKVIGVSASGAKTVTTVTDIQNLRNRRNTATKRKKTE